MTGTLRFISAVVLAAASSGQASATESSTSCSLKAVMSASQFEAAGLSKLTEEELQELDRWLKCDIKTEMGTTGSSPRPQLIVPASVGATGVSAYSRPIEPTYPLESVILGSFSGWSGGSRFALENGQIWKQRNNERYSYAGTDKRVTINKNFLGYFWLTHLDTGEKVPVKLTK